MKTDAVIAELGEGHVTLKCGTQTKTVTYQAFLEELSKNLAIEIKTERLALPPGTIFVSRSPAKIILATYNPGHIHEVTWDAENGADDAKRFTKFKIPLPNIVFQFELSLNKMWHVSNYTSKITTLSAEVVADCFNKGLNLLANSGEGIKFFKTTPFPNVYNNGTMCMGGNTATISMNSNDLRDLNRYYQILVDSPASSHIEILNISREHPAIKGKMASGRDARGYFKALSELTEFPYDMCGKFG